MGVPYPLVLSVSWVAGTAMELRVLLDEVMTAAKRQINEEHEVKQICHCSRENIL